MSTSIGLDIGSRAIKLVELEKTRGGIRLIKTGLALIPYREKESEAERMEGVTKALSGLLAELKIHRRSFHLAISGQSVFIRTIEVLAASREKLNQHIRFEAEQQIPFALNEVLWDFCLISSGQGKQQEKLSGKWKVILAAIKKNLVDRQLEFVEKIKGTSQLIDVGPIALYNSLCVLEPDSIEKTLVMVDIGAKATNLVITSAGDAWIRSFPLGSDKLTQAIADALHLGFNEAEVLKQRLDLQDSAQDPAEKQAISAILPALNDLIGEINRSLDYYSSQMKLTQPQGRLKIEKILLSGGGSQLAGLLSFFAEKLSASVEPWSELKKIPARSAFSGVNETQFAIATGLALRGLKHCPIELNLIRDQVAAQLKKRTLRWYGTGSLLLVLAILWTLVGFVRSEHRAKLAYLEELKATIREYQTYEPKIKDLAIQNGLLTNRVSALFRVVEQRQTWLEILKNLSGLMPKEVWITALDGGLELAVDGQDSTVGVIRLVGRSLSYQGVTDFVSGLKNSAQLTQVKPVASNIKKTETGEEVVEFQIEMKIAGEFGKTKE